MKINKKIFSLFALVFFLSCLVPVTVFAEEYVLGEKYYKNFPGTGNKWVELYSVTEYDEKGNEIYWQDADGYEDWYEYDKNGNEIHYKSFSGYEQWYEYDANGNLTHRKDSYGNEAWYEYDKNGNLIHSKTSNGGESWYEYSYRPDGTIKTAWEFIKF